MPIATTDPAAPTAIELVRQARALVGIYHQTWRLEDIEARICCYLRAFDALCDGDPLYASATPAPKNSVTGEPFAKKEDSHLRCAISA